MFYDEYERFCTRCMICDEYVTMSSIEAEHNVPKICDKCKAAVMKIREEMEQLPVKQGTDDDDYRLYSGLLSED